MKSTIGIILTASLFSVFPRPALFASDNKPAVSFKWNSDTHDFGAFNEDLGKVTCHFRGVNVGTDTASVIFLTASCGCTEPIADKKVIAPGDTVTLTVVYDANGRPGKFNKKISFGTSPAYRANFNITGNVISSTRRVLATYPYEVGDSYRISANSVSFGNVREDRSSTVVIRGINTTAENLIPTIVSTPSFVTASVQPDTVSPGSKFVISLTADAPKVGQLGASFSSLEISSASSPDATMKLPVSIMLFEDFPPLTADEIDRAAYLEIPQSKVDFGSDINPQSNKAIKRKIRVENKGQEPLTIRRAYTVTPGIDVKAPSKPIAPGKDAEIEIILIPASLPAGTTELRARVSVISNTPLNTTMDINVSGTVKAL